MPITYDRNGDAILTDPDGETTPVIRGQGDYQAAYPEPTEAPPQPVQGVADFIGAMVIVIIAGLMAAAAMWLLA